MSLTNPAALPATCLDKDRDATAKWALFVLTLVYVVNYIDRQIINVLAEPIKRELGLTDTQLGLMTGLVFAIFYSFMAIPIARLAERRSRPRVIAGCLVVWSTCTMLCGAAQTFPQMLLARLGVGVGESGSTPASQSLITDYFPPERRGRALGILSLGGPIGSLCGMLFGGLVAGLWGWRVAFLAAGLPGLILTVIVLRVVKDMRANVALSVPSLTFPEAFGAIARKRCFWLVCLGGAGYGFIALGTSAFVTSFFLRNHAAGLADIATPLGLSPIGFLGAALGILGGVGGMAGSLAGGTLGDRLSAGSPKGHVTLCAVSVLLLLPFHLLTMAIPDIRVALALWFMVVFFQFFYIGPMWATIQNLSPPGTRAIAGAIHLLCGNLIGLGLGPLFVGVASDHYQGAFGVDAAAGLKYALITLELAAVPTVFFFASCRRWIAEELYQPDT